MSFAKLLKKLKPDDARVFAVDVAMLMKDGIEGVKALMNKIAEILNKNKIPRSPAIAVTLIYFCIDCLKEFGFNKEMLVEMMGDLYDVHDSGLQQKVVNDLEKKLDEKPAN